MAKGDGNMVADDDSDKMLARKEGPIGRMIFNNPAKHNAVSLEMWDLAEGILDRFETDDEVRVLVLSGAGGKSFVSGADISRFAKERSTPEAVGSYNTRVAGVYERLESYPKPTVAMIDGYCIGGGLNLAVTCDLRFCSAKSQFAMPAARLGLGYPFASIRRLINALGPARARDLMYSARRVTAEEALQMGLVQKVLAEEEIESFVMDYARSIAANAPLTIAAMKFISGEVLKEPEARDHHRAAEMVARCFASEDYREGQLAFKEKRPPAFKGR